VLDAAPQSLDKNVVKGSTATVHADRDALAHTDGQGTLHIYAMQVGYYGSKAFRFLVVRSICREMFPHTKSHS
jgi:hypothetical protein